MDHRKENDKIKKYLEAVKEKKKAGYGLVIYGAGRMAGNLLELMETAGIPVTAFCVSDKRNNKKYFAEKKVYGIEELPFGKDEICILFGVNSKYNQALADNCRKYLFKNYIEAPEWLPYYGNNISAVYIKSPVLQVTTWIGCPVNCKYCPQGVFLKKYREHSQINSMSLEVFKKCLDKTPPETIVQFAGFSESFLNHQCLDMILYAEKLGRKIVIDTTLLGFHQETLQKLLDVDLFEFVLHVADKEMNANLPLTDEYMQNLETVFQAKKKNGNSFVDYANCQGTPHERIVALADGRVEFFTALHDRAGNLNENGLLMKKGLRGPLRCELMEQLNHWVLLPDGTVLLCDSDWGMENIIGNLYEQSYEEILNGEKLKEIKKKIASDTDSSLICRNCAHALSVQMIETP